MAVMNYRRRRIIVPVVSIRHIFVLCMVVIIFMLIRLISVAIKPYRLPIEICKHVTDLVYFISGGDDTTTTTIRGETRRINSSNNSNTNTIGGAIPLLFDIFILSAGRDSTILQQNITKTFPSKLRPTVFQEKSDHRIWHCRVVDAYRGLFQYIIHNRNTTFIGFLIVEEDAIFPIGAMDETIIHAIHHYPFLNLVPGKSTAAYRYGTVAFWIRYDFIPTILTECLLVRTNNNGDDCILPIDLCISSRFCFRNWVTSPIRHGGGTTSTRPRPPQQQQQQQIMQQQLPR